ncbi:hypothetical protein Avbf_10620, partial [Armadillidium vulgare]
PTIEGNIEVKCQNNGNWSSLPRGFDCVTFKHAEKLRLDPQIIPHYDYYNDHPKPANDEELEKDWLLFITIPCAAIIAFLIFCLLCCTRLGSPIFKLCRGDTRNDAYIW